MSTNTVSQQRRNFLKGSAATAGLMAVSGLTVMAPAAHADALSQEKRDAMTPDQVIEMLKAGNERFVTGKMLDHDYKDQQMTSAAGQFPAAVLLSCIDSRAPAEIVFDAGIGDMFNSRIAGNVADTDVLGGMEFACALAGAKLVLVLGHTKCGAVKGAVAGAELGNLTSLLSKIKPAIGKTTYTGIREASNYDFVDAVAKTNVQLTIEHIRNSSETLSKLEKEGKIKIVGAMYDISTRKVEFLA